MQAVNEIIAEGLIALSKKSQQLLLLLAFLN